jgi:hypothetical protein
MFTKLKIRIAAKAAEEFGEAHRKEFTSMPKWLQIVLNILVNAGAAYVGAKYPAYLPIVAAGAGSIGIPLTLHALNTEPTKK